MESVPLPPGDRKSRQLLVVGLALLAVWFFLGVLPLLTSWDDWAWRRAGHSGAVALYGSKFFTQIHFMLLDLPIWQLIYVVGSLLIFSYLVKNRGPQATLLITGAFSLPFLIIFIITNNVFDRASVVFQ